MSGCGYYLPDDAQRSDHGHSFSDAVGCALIQKARLKPAARTVADNRGCDGTGGKPGTELQELLQAPVRRSGF